MSGSISPHPIILQNQRLMTYECLISPKVITKVMIAASECLRIGSGSTRSLGRAARSANRAKLLDKRRHYGVYVLGDPLAVTYGAAQISIMQNRITDGGGALQLNGVHDDPYVSIHHNEITKTHQKYSGDLLNI